MCLQPGGQWRWCCVRAKEAAKAHTHRGILAGHLAKLSFILNIIVEKLLENL